LDGRDNLLFLAIGHFLSPEQVSGVSLQRQWVALPSKISYYSCYFHGPHYRKEHAAETNAENRSLGLF
jgi:hypothetical protein